MFSEFDGSGFVYRKNAKLQKIPCVTTYSNPNLATLPKKRKVSSLFFYHQPQGFQRSHPCGTITQGYILKKQVIFKSGPYLEDE
jgi:hypothetical protein